MIDITNSISIGSAINGISWSSYWRTLISATVENAAPTHVVLTFPAAQTSLTDTDFTISGFTIASSSWTGAVLTLVLSYPALVFWGDLTITFVRTGETATVTNNVLDDGNTVGWYDASDLSTITKDESDIVSQWDSKSSLNHLIQGVSTARPKYESDGIVFDGVDDFMYDAFTLEQPTMIYVVVKQVTWTVNKYLMDGHAGSSTGRIMQRTESPNIHVRAGVDSADSGDLSVGDFGIIRVLFNGANSKFIVNDNTPITGDFGSNDMGGIKLAARGGTSTAFGNVKFREIILRSVDENSAIEESIYNYLCQKHGFFLT